MTYEFFAILKDGTEVSIVDENLDTVKKAMQDFIVENYDTGWHSTTIYHPHENVEWAKKLSRDAFIKKQSKKKKK